MTQFVKAVLFDLDGTLIDTAADFVRIIEQMSREHGWYAPSETDIRQQVSAGASAMIKLMLRHNGQPQVTDEQLLGFRQQFLDNYEANICVKSRVFEDLEEVLVTLEQKNVPWGIVTNKPRYLAEQLLNKMRLSERCAALVCPEDVSRPKPDPESMYMALEKLGMPRGASGCVLYVGDHTRDIEAGNAAGMPTILAAYGYIPPEDQKTLKKWGANYIVETPKQLNTLLLSSGTFEYF